MPEKNLPQTYKGYSTKSLLETWEEIKRPEGTKAPQEMIFVMREFLREYRLGLFEKVEGLNGD